MELKERLKKAVWCCQDCGKKYGRNPNKGGVSTWHLGICDVCLKTDVYVTEPRDFGYFTEPTPRQKFHDML